MKRVTVAITLDQYCSQRELRGLKASMVAAGVHKATEQDMSIVAIEARVANNVRKVPK